MAAGGAPSRSAGGCCRSNRRVCSRVAAGSRPLIGQGLAGLGQLGAVGFDHQRHMGVAGHAQSQRRGDANLPGRAVHQVRAAHDVGDALRGVVDDHRQLVGRHAVAPEYDRVAQLATCVSSGRPSTRSWKRDGIAGIEAQSPCGRCRLRAPRSRQRPEQAPPVSLREQVQRYTRSGAAQCLRGRRRSARGARIDESPAHRCACPAMQASSRMDLVHAGQIARGVEVLDADQPGAGLGAGVEEAGQRRRPASPGAAGRWARAQSVRDTGATQR